MTKNCSIIYGGAVDYYPRTLGAEPNNGEHDPSDYDEVTELEWVLYEFSTIAYDYKIHPKAVDQIISLFQRLVK